MNGDDPDKEQKIKRIRRAIAALRFRCKVKKQAEAAQMNKMTIGDELAELRREKAE